MSGTLLAIIYTVVLVAAFLLLMPRLKSSMTGENAKTIYKLLPILFVLLLIAPYGVKYLLEKFNYYNNSVKVAQLVNEIEQTKKETEVLEQKADSVYVLTGDTIAMHKIQQQMEAKQKSLEESNSQLEQLSKVADGSKFFYSDNAQFADTIRKISNKIDKEIVKIATEQKQQNPTVGLKIVYYKKTETDTILPYKLKSEGYEVVSVMGRRNRDIAINTLFYGADVKKADIVKVARILTDNNTPIKDIQYYLDYNRDKGLDYKANVLEIGSSVRSVDKPDLTIAQIEALTFKGR